jgi:short-subunit dehydrogenase
MDTDRRNTGDVAWITGASSGIGRALALRLVRDGYRVAASARRAEELQALERETAGAVRAFPLDVMDGRAAHETLAAIEADMGPVSLAVFAAGTYVRDKPSRFDAAALRTMVELNILGVGNGLEAVIPGMVSRGRGRIGIVASVSGYAGLPGGGFYGATKSALITLAEAMYPELKRKGVGISIINPGFVKTPLTDANDFPMPFLISAEDAADRIAAGLKSGKFEIAFPRRMVFALKLLRLLPYPLFFRLTAKMLRDKEAG